jgi:hypothetical protein
MMGTLDHWERAVFVYSPFVRPTSSFSGAPREYLEEEMVGLCAVNRLALRLVVGLGFNPYFLRHRPARGVWKWLLRPEATRRFSDLHHPPREWRDLIVVAADTQHRDERAAAHGIVDERCDSPCSGHPRCPWCILVYRREAATALAIGAHLMRAYDADQQRQRRLREMLRNNPPPHDVLAAQISLALINKAARLRDFVARHYGGDSHG